LSLLGNASLRNAEFYGLCRPAAATYIAVPSPYLMSEFYPDPEPSQEPAFRNIDECPMKPSLIRGGAVAFLLMFVPFALVICCLPLVAAALVGVFDYTKRYRISLDIAQGMKVGVLCCLLGYGAYTIFYDIVWAVFDYQIGVETYQNVLRGMIESLPPEAAELMDEGMSESVEEMSEQKFSILALIPQLFIAVLVSAVGGAIGGLIGSAMFKKGPEAK